jgi:hypothetical protein
METIAWQAGQVGDWNSTRLGRGPVSTAVSKLPESSTRTFEAAPVGAVGAEAVVGEDPPPPQPASRPAIATTTALPLT